MNMPPQPLQRQSHGDLMFAVQTALMIIVTHAIAYLTHEYAHSVTAWALGFMADPFALDYGSATPANLILLSSVGDNVQYAPILQGGHGLAAAVIALAGAGIGNGVLYGCLYASMRRVAQPRPLVAAFTFWLLTMCVGNVFSYVPIRAIATHADIALAAAGLHVDVWMLFPFLLVPTILLLLHYFACACPRFIAASAQGRSGRTALMTALAPAWLFAFYGSAGLSGSYGPVAQALSLVALLLLLPVAIAWLSRRCLPGAG